MWVYFSLFLVAHALTHRDFCSDTYADEWIVKGNEIVEQMLERVPKKEATQSPATAHETAS